MTDYEIVDVTKLQKAEGVKDGDTLLLIRQQGDGTSICMRTDGAQFKGTDAYDVAKANGFSGTREEWAQQVARVNEVSAAIDNANDTASHPTKIGADNYVYEWDKATKAYQKTGILVKGDKGERGATGAQGEQGPQGAKGETGARGAQGATGPQGAQGAKGDRGENGKSPIIKNASWWIWDEASGAYKDSGMSVSSQYTLTKEAIEGVLTGDVSSHTHSAYALMGHTHTQYAAADHTHSNYALTTHKHTEYAAVSHTHDNYALTGHKHTEYVPTTALSDYYTKKEVEDMVGNAGGGVDESWLQQKGYLKKSDMRETVVIKLVSDKGESDSGLIGATITVKSGDTTVSTLTWQGTPIKVEVPCDKDVTIEAAVVKMYMKPKALKYMPSPLYNREVTFTYKALMIGVFFIDINDNLINRDSWDNNKDTIVGVALITEKVAIVMAPKAKQYLKWSEQAQLVEKVTTTLKYVDAVADFNGKANTEAIVSALGTKAGAAYYCSNYTFKNGKKGHLMSAGEAQEMCLNETTLSNMLNSLDSSSINFDTGNKYWTSTQTSDSLTWVIETNMSIASFNKTYTKPYTIPIYSLYD